MYGYLIGALVVMAAVGGAYIQGRSDGGAGVRIEWEEANAAATAEADKDRQAQEQKAKSLSRRLEAKIATQTITNREITEQLEIALGKANLPASCDITDDLMRIWNDANKGSSSKPGGELHGGSAASAGAKVEGRP